jgi:cytochrome P450
MVNSKKYRLPPGPSFWRTLIGTWNYIKDPINTLNRSMEIYSGTFYSGQGIGPRVIVTRNPELINHVLKDNHRGYAKSLLATEKASKLMGNGILFTNGEYWLRQRRMIQPAFHREKLQALNGIITKAINDSLNGFPVGYAVDICPFMHVMALNVLLQSVFNISLSIETVEEIMQLFEDIQQFLMDDATGVSRLFYFVTRADTIAWKKSVRLRAIIRGMVRQRGHRQGENADLLETLMHGTYEDTGESMSEEQIIDEILILIFAGHETTANTLSWLLYLLASAEPVRQKLTASLSETAADGVLANDYLRATINEGMRLYPAAWMTERVALEDDSSAGYSYPKGTIIISYLFGLHHDQGFWKEPWAFTPERFIDDPGIARSRHFYPFGAGPRMCVGNNFAIVEMSFFLFFFLQKYRIEPTGQVPVMKARITLKPDKVILNIARGEGR